ncbi:YafY family protein [Streptomyces sp. TLI_171]|uniref:helix-turn-helix transcriptional regulator n=1 Tax=Streptomyces sp. TLI_171 TaxID=1938859 RepID=UPI000C192C72|nr:WYL domain-containing protein [Streptomyces sp. TLI_171]RKE17832.1 putative DNA-binding transcriptional regulator YafY [Streptomyces sp. TLI_171]
MRADRLLALLLLLQNRGRMTAAELATELEVSVRTVHRDVEALGAAGVPVLAERGPTGGYRLMDGYRTRLTGLTAGEAGALFFAGLPGPARELGLGTLLATAELKVRAALPAELAESTRQLQERFHLDPASWFHDPDPVPLLTAVARAVWEQQVLDVHYRRWRGEVQRELRPLGMVLKAGIWYLAASADDQVRTYRVSRLLSAEPTGAHFERPPGFDLAAHWSEFARRLAASLHQDTAEVRVSPRAFRMLPMQFGSAGARAVASAGPPDADGWVRVLLPVESEPVAVSDLLRLGADADVLGPPSLRAAVAEAVAALHHRYTRTP